MLTRKKRHEFYRSALIFVQSNIHHTLCYALLKVSGIDLGESPEQFPEIVSRKPANRSLDSGLWWDKTEDGQKERIRVLIESIRETETRTMY